MGLKVLETDRLILRRLTTADSEFIFDLLNQPSFLQYIGDRGVRTLADAERLIQEGPIATYEMHGFGLYLVETKEAGESIGMCGLLRREQLDAADVGFAFLPEFWSRGYAIEAASAVKDYSKSVLGLDRIVAIANPDNERSFNLLAKLGLRYDCMIRLSDDTPEIKLFIPVEDNIRE